MTLKIMPKSKKKLNKVSKCLNKGISTPLALTIIIVLAVFLAGGTLGYQYYWAPKQEAEKQKAEEQKAEEEITREKISEDETSDWKTYRNEEYGFEVKYPLEWSVKNENEKGISIWSPERRKLSEEHNGDYYYTMTDFNINCADTTSFKEFVRGLTNKDINNVKDFLQFYYPIFTEINIAGKKAYATVVVSSVSDYVIYVEFGNGVYILSTPYNDEAGMSAFDLKNPNINPTVKEIISTFKFID